MPRRASLPNRSDNGKLSPEFCSNVLLPEPGGPITTYQGSVYRLPPPWRLLRSVSTASWNREASCARSLALRSSPVAESEEPASCTAMSPDIFAVLLRRRSCWICRNTTQATSSTMITTSRVTGLANGWLSPIPR